MRLVSACCSLLVLAAVFPRTDAAVASRPAPAASRVVGYFEPPRSIGTPLEDLVRSYTGHGLASRIAGRIRLDTDASLSPVARQLIRRRLAQGD
jgi:hypothetical protein